VIPREGVVNTPRGLSEYPGKVYRSSDGMLVGCHYVTILLPSCAPAIRLYDGSCLLGRYRDGGLM
jgi:hypothetical protein